LADAQLVSVPAEQHLPVLVFRVLHELTATPEVPAVEAQAQAALAAAVEVTARRLLLTALTEDCVPTLTPLLYAHAPNPHKCPSSHSHAACTRIDTTGPHARQHTCVPAVDAAAAKRSPIGRPSTGPRGLPAAGDPRGVIHAANPLG
jgi:hypothetical protein